MLFNTGFLKKLPLFLILFLFSVLAQAFSPEWITQQTRGRVKYTQATNIISLVYKHALNHEVDPTMVFAIITVESNYNAKAVSPKGAQGLMQVMRKYHRDKINSRNLRDPDVNIEVGTRIYKEYLDKYKTPKLALRAYLGNHISDDYPNRVFAVRNQLQSSIYPGSDDRAEKDKFTTPCCEEDHLAQVPEVPTP
jgi:soluble lytic murein transglycosylase-like protein